MFKWFSKDVIVPRWAILLACLYIVFLRVFRSYTVVIGVGFFLVVFIFAWIHDRRMDHHD